MNEAYKWRTLERQALPLQNECPGNSICKLLQSKCTLQEGTKFCRKWELLKEKSVKLCDDENSQTRL